jgi:hypothetical protein
VKRKLLACGILAGPPFVAVGLLQTLVRDGFDLGRHPLSLLSLGELGWIQITSFVVTGVLYLACAVGIRGCCVPGRASRGTQAAQLARHPARGRDSSWRFCRARPPVCVRAPIRHPQAVEVGRSGRYGRTGGPVLTQWPGPDGISVRLGLASVIQFGFVSAVAARLTTELADDVTGSIDAAIEVTTDDRSWAVHAC